MKRVRSLIEREIVRKKQNSKPLDFYDQIIKQSEEMIQGFNLNNLKNSVKPI